MDRKNCADFLKVKLRFFWGCLDPFLLCATQKFGACDRKIGAICAEKSSYTRVDGNFEKLEKFLLSGHEKFAAAAAAFTSSLVDWRLVRIFRQFLHQFFFFLLALLRTRNKVSLLGHDSPNQFHISQRNALKIWGQVQAKFFLIDAVPLIRIFGAIHTKNRNTVVLFSKLV